MSELTKIDEPKDLIVGTADLVSDRELNMQIATARKYPRSIKAFRQRVVELSTLTETVAKECIYALPRGNKVIEGPSIRFAEIVQSAWGNCRVGGRVTGEDEKFITAQGMFHDLETNSAIVMETRRRVTDSKGKRYNDDMIGVTGAAATGIAVRNAVLRGIPKAFWADMYDAARRHAVGDVKTLANRCEQAISAFAVYGVSEAQILNLFGIENRSAITTDHIGKLIGLYNSIKDGSVTPEDAFPSDKPVADAPPPPPPPPPPKPTRAPAKPKAAVKPEPEPEPETETETETEPEDEVPPPHPDLPRYIELVKRVTDADEIEGMRETLKEELSEADYATWQGEALRREAFLRGRKR